MHISRLFTQPLRRLLSSPSEEGPAKELFAWEHDRQNEAGDHGDRLRFVGVDVESSADGLVVVPDPRRHCHVVFGGGSWNSTSDEDGWLAASDAWYRCDVEASLPEGVAQLFCLTYDEHGRLEQKRALGGLERWGPTTVYRFRVPAEAARFALALYLPRAQAPSRVVLRSLSLSAFDLASDTGGRADLASETGIATGAQRPSEYYDLHIGRDLAPLEESPWRHLYEAAASLLPPPETASTIVDVGCGTGRFAECLRRRGYTDYCGIDFSANRVEQARRYVPGFRFEHMDAFSRKAKRLFSRNRSFVLLEILEHVTADLELVERLPSGATVVLSVPNYPSAGHVRHFSDVGDARSRYSPHIDVDADMTVTIDERNHRSIFVLKGRRP